MTDLEAVPLGDGPRPCPSGSMIVHTEFQRLMDAYDDAAYRWATDLENESRRIMLDNYQAMQQRKRELYEWVVAHTPRPASAYRLIHRF